MFWQQDGLVSMLNSTHISYATSWTASGVLCVSLQLLIFAVFWQHQSYLSFFCMLSCRWTHYWKPAIDLTVWYRGTQDSWTVCHCIFWAQKSFLYYYSMSDNRSQLTVDRIHNTDINALPCMMFQRQHHFLLQILKPSAAPIMKEGYLKNCKWLQCLSAYNWNLISLLWAAFSANECARAASNRDWSFQEELILQMCNSEELTLQQKKLL